MQNKRPYKTVNTFSRRPCLNQIFSYLILVLDNFSFWLTVQHHFTSDICRFIMISIFALSLLLLLLFGCLTSSYDPADPIMVRQRNDIAFEVRSDQLCLYCQHCESYVRLSSKHCKVCDRCVQDFDHHCIWINNCIGKYNYKVFIGMIVSAEVHLIVYVIGVVLLWSQGKWDAYLPQMILNWIVLGIVFLFSVLLLALVILHFYLIAHNITTFQFMTNRRIAQINPAKETVKQIVQTSSNDINMKNKESSINQKNGENKDHHHSTQLLQQTPIKTNDKDASKEEEEERSEQFKESRLKILRPQRVIRPKSEMDKRTDLQLQNGQDILKNSKALKLLIGNGLRIKSLRNTISSKNLKKEKQISFSNRSQQKHSEYQMKQNEKFQNINFIFQQ